MKVELISKRIINMKMQQMLAILILLFVSGLVAMYAGYGLYVGAIGGILLVLIALFEDLRKKFGIKKDAEKWALFLVGAGLVFVPAVNLMFANLIAQTAAMVGGIGVIGAVQQPTPIQPAVTGGQPIIATTAILTVAAENALNKTFQTLNPSGYYYTDGSYKTLSFSSGKATISSLDPYTVIDKIAIGTSGTYYWEIVENFNMNGKLSPTVSMKLVPISTSYNLHAYSTLYSEINGSLKNTSNAVAAGGSINGFLRFEATTDYAGVRAPIIACEYNTSIVDEVTFPGLNIIDCPTRLITASDERSVARCYDTGYAWFVDSASKITDLTGKIANDYKDFSFEINYLTGADDPIATGGGEGHAVTFHIVDRDKSYRGSASQLFFLDPDTGTTDQGWTTEPSCTVWAS